MYGTTPDDAIARGDVSAVMQNGGLLKDFTVEDGCSGMFANDIGLYDDFDPSTGGDTFHVVDPVSTGGDGGW